ncbi:MAG: hypothetical protein WBV82_09770 [Myxococcaceae bacterium]
MAELTERRVPGAVQPVGRTTTLDYQAFRILHVAFIVAPTIAGLDKFFYLLTDWSRYLAPPLASAFGARPFMYVVGVIEIAAGLLVAVKPKIGAYVVAAWLFGIICNLVWLSALVPGNYLDIALRDFGLMLGALALGRLAEAHERGEHGTVAPRRVT